MDRLSPELLIEIFDLLDFKDHLALSLMNRRLRLLAQPYIFRVLNLGGDSVEYAHLPDAVERILPFADCVEIFKFSPKFYRQGKRPFASMVSSTICCGQASQFHV
jgi:F-box domain